MTPEEQAALERYGNTRFGTIEDMRTICQLALREHPADSDDAITKDWLLSVGGIEEEHPDKVTFRRFAAIDIGFWSVGDGWKVMLLLAEHAASCIRRGLYSRGDVRRLCQALGIELGGER